MELCTFAESHYFLSQVERRGEKKTQMRMCDSQRDTELPVLCEFTSGKWQINCPWWVYVHAAQTQALQKYDQ